MKALVILSGAPMGLIIGAIAVVVVLLLVLLFAAGYVKAAPDTAIIISGMGKRKILIACMIYLNVDLLLHQTR